jgi:hypothetical protein
MASDRAGRFYYATLAFDQFINLGVSSHGPTTAAGPGATRSS